VIDLFTGIGGFTNRTHAVLLLDGRMPKVFLAVDNDQDKGRVFQRNNPQVPFLKYSLGNDFSLAKEMIKDFVPSDLLPFAFAYANPPAIASTGLDSIVNTRMVHWTIGLFAMLAPGLSWTIKQLPGACNSLSAPSLHAQNR